MPKANKPKVKRRKREKGSPEYSYVWAVAAHERDATPERTVIQPRTLLCSGPYEPGWPERIRMGEFSAYAMDGQWSRIEARDHNGMIISVECVRIPTQAQVAKHRRQRAREEEQRAYERAENLERMMMLARKAAR